MRSSAAVEVLNLPGCRRGDTALHWAAFKGELAIAEALLGHGASVVSLALQLVPSAHALIAALVQDAEGDLGNRPLHLAASQGHWLLCRLLLRHGASVVRLCDIAAD